MKLKIFDPAKAEKGSKELPAAFSEEVRADLIKRAVESLQSRARQRYGADPKAGKKASANLSRRRRKYRGSYGHGISRVPRKILSRSGTRFNWTGAFSPGTVGGRRAHPPKPAKIWARKINDKERMKAIRSAIAATMSKETVQERGHALPEGYPFIITDGFESLSKTKQVREALVKLGMADELKRAAGRTYRTGKSRLRGRKYRKRKGPLFIVSKDCPLRKAACNIPGVEAVTASQLNAELLAPGAVPGRLALFTESAVDMIAKENLFNERPRKERARSQEKGQEEGKATAKPKKKKRGNKTMKPEAKTQGSKAAAKA